MPSYFFFFILEKHHRKRVRTRVFRQSMAGPKPSPGRVYILFSFCGDPILLFQYPMLIISSIMAKIRDYIKTVHKRITTIGCWQDDADATIYVGLIALGASLLLSILALIIFKLIHSDILFLIVNTVIITVGITAVFLNLYKRIISGPVRAMKDELNKLSVNETSSYTISGKMSQPFRDTTDSITWEDQVRFYMDFATSGQYIDELTGCFNRKYFMQKLSRFMEYSCSSASGKNHATYDTEEYAIFMVDIDHFKQVNDDFGHASGDAVLKDVGRLLRDTVGDKGVVVRNGGEEFVIVYCHNYPFDFSEVAAEINNQFRENISIKSPTDGKLRRITCSVGLVKYPMYPGANSQLSVSQHLDVADMAMYFSKTHGRNQWNEIYAGDRLIKDGVDKRIDISSFLSDPEYGLKRGLLGIRSASGEVKDVAEGIVES